MRGILPKCVFDGLQYNSRGCCGFLAFTDSSLQRTPLLSSWSCMPPTCISAASSYTWIRLGIDEFRELWLLIQVFQVCVVDDIREWYELVMSVQSANPLRISTLLFESFLLALVLLWLKGFEPLEVWINKVSLHTLCMAVWLLAALVWVWIRSEKLSQQLCAWNFWCSYTSVLWGFHSAAFRESPNKHIQKTRVLNFQLLTL